jgi:hypothetical protein
MTKYTVMGKRNEISAKPKKYERWHRTAQRRSLEAKAGNWGSGAGGTAPEFEARSGIMADGV